VLHRDERFGYVELAANGFESPSLSPESITKSALPHFIDVSRRNGQTRVTLAVAMRFGLDSGEPEDWQRLVRDL
jgi:hypothetical protein